MNILIAGLYETEKQAEHAIATFRKSNHHDLADQLELELTIYKQNKRKMESKP